MTHRARQHLGGIFLLLLCPQVLRDLWNRWQDWSIVNGVSVFTLFAAWLLLLRMVIANRTGTEAVRGVALRT